MKAWIVDRYGKNEKLRAGEVPDPVLGHDVAGVVERVASTNDALAYVERGRVKGKVVVKVQ